MAKGEVVKDQNAEKSVRRLAKSRDGVVISNKMDKTVVVEVRRLVEHPLYKKYVQKSKRYYAHDEKDTCEVGDTVRIVETRPLSKLKRWRVAQILRKVEVAKA